MSQGSDGPWSIERGGETGVNSHFRIKASSFATGSSRSLIIAYALLRALRALRGEGIFSLRLCGESSGYLLAFPGVGYSAYYNEVQAIIVSIPSDFPTKFDLSAYELAHSPVNGDAANYQDYIIKKSVPEPMTLLQLGIGLLGIGLLRRRSN